MRMQQANLCQLNLIVDMVKRAILKMESQDIFQWNDTYPSKDIFKQDIDRENLFVVVDKDRLVACFALNQETDERYRQGDFQYHGTDYIVVHRFCVEPDIQNRGMGRLSLMLLEAYARQRGCQAIWLDASDKNPYSNRLYLSAGFNPVGRYQHNDGFTNMYELLL